MAWDYAEHAKPCEGCQNVMWGNLKAEKTNPMNGLSLNALHDKAFDKRLNNPRLSATVLYSNVLKLFTYNNKNYRHWVFL